MIKDDIIKELEQDSKIDKTLCLQTLAKVKRGDMTGFTEIDDVDAHIAALR